MTMHLPHKHTYRLSDVIRWGEPYDTWGGEDTTIYVFECEDQLLCHDPWCGGGDPGYYIAKSSFWGRKTSCVETPD